MLNVPGNVTLTAYQFYGALDLAAPLNEPIYGPLLVLNFTHDCTLDTANLQRHNTSLKILDIPANPPGAPWTANEMAMARNGSSTAVLVDMAESYPGCLSMSRIIEQANSISDTLSKYYSVGPVRLIVFSHPIAPYNGGLDLNGQTTIDYGNRLLTFYDDYWTYLNQLTVNNNSSGSNSGSNSTRNGTGTNRQLQLLMTSQSNTEWMKTRDWSTDTAKGPLYVKAIIDPGPWNRALYSTGGICVIIITRLFYATVLTVALYWSAVAFQLRSLIWLPSHAFVVVCIALSALAGLIWPPALLFRNAILFVTSISWCFGVVAHKLVMVRWTWFMQGSSDSRYRLILSTDKSQRSQRLLTTVRIATWTAGIIMSLTHIVGNTVVYLLRWGFTPTAMLIHTIFQPAVIFVCNGTAIIACSLFLYSMGTRVYYSDERKLTKVALAMITLSSLYDICYDLERIESIFAHVQTAAAIESLRQIMLFGANMTALWLSGNIHYVMATTMPGAHPGVELDPLGALTPHIPRNRNRSGGSIGSGGSSIGGGGISAVHPAEGKVRRRSRQLLV